MSFIGLLGLENVLYGASQYPERSYVQMYRLRRICTSHFILPILGGGRLM